MSLNRSLKSKGKLSVVRTVLTRPERIAKMKANKTFDPKKDTALGLPKTRTK